MPEDANKSPWTPDTVREFIMAMIDSNDRRYTQNADASQIALKAAFEAQQTAMQAAFAAQKEAVQAAFSAQKEAIAAALAAAKEAVNKAETAAEIRFSLLSVKIATLETAISQNTGRSSGLQAGWGYLVAGISTLSTIILLLLRVLGK